MAKKRSKSPYYGNNPEMIRRQRVNLILGNRWQKRKIQEARLDCWWKLADLKSKQFIYEDYVNGRDFKDVDVNELLNEEELDRCWRGLVIENKKAIYEAMMKELTPEEKALILKSIETCLKEKMI